jgi:hypothetical protein
LARSASARAPLPAGYAIGNRIGGEILAMHAWPPEPAPDAGLQHCAGPRDSRSGRSLFQCADRVAVEQAYLNRVVDRVGQNRAIPPRCARGRTPAVEPTGGLVEYPAPDGWLGQCRHREAVVGNPGEDLSDVLGRIGSLLGLEPVPKQGAADSSVVWPPACFRQQRRGGREVIVRCPSGTWPRPASTSCRLPRAARFGK